MKIDITKQQAQSLEHLILENIEKYEGKMDNDFVDDLEKVLAKLAPICNGNPVAEQPVIELTTFYGDDEESVIGCDHHNKNFKAIGNGWLVCRDCNHVV